MDLSFDGKSAEDIHIQPSGPSAEHLILEFKNVLATPGKAALGQAAKVMVRAVAGVQDADPEDREALQAVLANLIYALILREQCGFWPAPHVKALLGLGDPGRRIALRGLAAGAIPPEGLHRSLEECSILDQFRLLNMALLKPRGMAPETSALIWDRLTRLMRTHPDQWLAVMEELGRLDAPLAFPAQRAVMDSAFWVWLKQVMREKLEDEHAAYLARALSRLQTDESAAELARLLRHCGDQALPQVLRALGQAGTKRDPRLIKAVHQLFRHQSRAVRLAALASVIELRDPEAPKALARLSAKSPGDPDLLLLACRLDQAGLKTLLTELDGRCRREVAARILSLLAQLKPKALAGAADKLAPKDAGAARTAIKDFLLAHEELPPEKPARIKASQLPLYASPPEPAEPDPPQGGLFKRPKTPPTLPELLASGAKVQGGYFAGQTVSGDKINGAFLDDAVLCRVRLSKTRLTDSTFTHMDGCRLTMNQAVLHGCEFAGVRFCQATMERCRIQGCAFTGCDFSAAQWRGCVLKDCVFTACLFDYAELSETRFENCRLDACSFQSTRLQAIAGRGVRFDLAWMDRTLAEAVQVQGFDLADSRVQHCRFASLALDGVDAEGSLLRNCDLLASDVFAPDFLALEESTLEQALVRVASEGRPPPDSWRSWDGPALALAVRLADFWIMYRDASRNVRLSLENNLRRLNWARAKLPKDCGSFLALLPTLVTADLSAHAGEAGGVGVAIAGYTPGFGHAEELARLLDQARIPAPRDGDLHAEGLYSIGSTGSIAQTEASDIDLWLVMAPNQDPERLKSLQRKLEWIEQWAGQSLGLEVHFFLMDLEKTRANDFGISDEEGAGSAQALLLKEEFYRTVLCLAGKVPAWWTTPAAAGEKASWRFIAVVNSTMDFLSRRVVDLGRLGDIPPGEFFGASLWQIVKALKSPFKSVLKLGLLEKYLDRERQASTLLCDQLKANLLDGMGGLWEADPYAMLFKEVNDHYQSAGDLEALRLLRTAFLLKTGMGLSRLTPGTSQHGVGASLSEFFFPPHPFNLMARGETADELDSFAAREYTGQQVAQFMARAYERIRKRLGRIKETSISDQDLTKLGRRISSFFGQREHKIMRIPFMNPQKDAFQSLEFTAETAGGMVRAWIVKGAATTPDGKPGKAEKLRRETEPMRLLGWLIANSVFSPSQYLSIDPNLSPVSSTDIETLLAQLHAFFPAKKTFFTDLDENLKPERVTAVFAAVNLLCARNHESVREAALLYATNWGELFCLPRTASPETIAAKPQAFFRDNLPPPLAESARVEVFWPPKSKCPKIPLPGFNA